MMYIVKLNGKKYGINLSETTANIQECVAVKEKEHTYDDDIMDIPDLFLDDDDEMDSEIYITTSMPGKIISLNVEEGESIDTGDTLLVLESMKMENEITSNCKAKVKKIYVSKGDKVEKGKKLFALSKEG